MADADGEQEIQALKAEMGFLTERLSKNQAQVKADADRRRIVARELVERGVSLAEIARSADITYQAVQLLLRP